MTRRRTRTRAELKRIRRHLREIVAATPTPRYLPAPPYSGGRSLAREWQRLTGYVSVEQRDRAQEPLAREEAVRRAKAAGIHLP